MRRTSEKPGHLLRRDPRPGCCAPYPVVDIHPEGPPGRRDTQTRQSQIVMESASALCPVFLGRIRSDSTFLFAHSISLMKCTSLSVPSSLQSTAGEPQRLRHRQSLQRVHAVQLQWRVLLRPALLQLEVERWRRPDYPLRERGRKSGPMTRFRRCRPGPRRWRSGPQWVFK